MKLNLKLVSLIIILLLSVSTYAETFTAATITSDYLARGITQNNGESAVQGKIEESEIIPNSLVGLWLSNAVGSNNTAESEVDLYARYNLISDDNVKLSFLALFYYYTKTHAFNTWDYQIIFENSYANLLFSYRDDFFGTKSKNLYYEISKKIEINSQKKLSLLAVLGFAYFNDTDKAGMDNYANHGVSLIKTIENNEFTLFYSNTDRRTIAGTSKNKAYDQNTGVSVTHIF